MSQTPHNSTPPVNPKAERRRAREERRRMVLARLAAEADTRVAYDPEEFAALVKLTRRSVDRAIARQEIRAIKIGGAVRIPRAEVDRILGATG